MGDRGRVRARTRSKVAKAPATLEAFAANTELVRELLATMANHLDIVNLLLGAGARADRGADRGSSHEPQ